MKKTMQEFWDDLAKEGTWSSYYQRPRDLQTYNFYTRREGVADLLQGESFKDVLDIGCGTGDYQQLAKGWDARYTGIDYAYSMVNKGTKIQEKDGLRGSLVQGSGEYLPFVDTQFDLVLAMGYIEYFKQPEITLREIRRVMKPGATLVMQSFKWEVFGNWERFVVNPVKKALGRNNGPDIPDTWFNQKYSRKELDALLAKEGFEVQDHVYNNFFVMPRSFRRRWPQRYIRMSEKIARSRPKSMGTFAVNYIGKYLMKG